ncbi:hypothetical protein V500_03394, partial [Pseudogymnoascus sp. VKM F-4518 (FW-2643)]
MLVGEYRNPGRDLPRVLHTAMPIVIASYLLANMAYFFVLPLDAIGALNATALTVAAWSTLLAKKATYHPSSARPVTQRVTSRSRLGFNMVNAISWLERRASDAIATEMWQAQMRVGRDQTEAQKLISSLVFANSKSIRTFTVILASFNGVAAFATAFSILYDCYCASKRYGNGSSSKKFFLWAMHPAETFPLVLALGIVVQGV